MAERTFSELPDASGRFVLGATVSRFTSSHFRASIDGSMFNACMKRGKGKPMNGQTAFQKGRGKQPVMACFVPGRIQKAL